ncbi:hypothetical protein PO909_032821 [Leuciscus waleckii]
MLKYSITRSVVGQIDKLTSDFDLDLEPDDWTVATASSTSSSERGLGEAFRLDFLGQDMLSDSWDFCNFLESANRKAHRDEPDEAQTRPTTASVYSQMNGGLPVPNGPLIITPDSSSEEASSSTHSQKTSRTSGTRERIPPLSSSDLYNCRETASAGPSPVKVSMIGSHTLPRKGLLNPGCRKKLLRNSSTQTVSDKSTQTVLPYVPAKQKSKDL